MPSNVKIRSIIYWNEELSPTFLKFQLFHVKVPFLIKDNSFRNKVHNKYKFEFQKYKFYTKLYGENMDLQSEVKSNKTVDYFSCLTLESVWVKVSEMPCSLAPLRMHCALHLNHLPFKIILNGIQQQWKVLNAPPLFKQSSTKALT